MRALRPLSPSPFLQKERTPPPYRPKRAKMAGKYGGFDEDFVGEVKDTLICYICTKPLRDPHLTVCCGHNFCESCLEQCRSMKHREQCCPFCRSTGEEFQHVLDKKTKREINALKVRCSNRKKGCRSVGWRAWIIERSP